MAQERKHRTVVSPGDRFGQLTVLYDTGRRQNNRIVWECVCSCGGHVEKTSFQLTGRGNLSCGCESRKEKLTGQRFGYLTVLKNSGEHDKSYILWDCLCDCGNMCKVNSHRLLAGIQTDCGCRSDLIGRKFGRLTVIGDEGTRTGDHVWKCLCECGKKCLVTSSHLTHGRVKSCGCLRDNAGRDSLRLVDGTSVTKLEARRANSDKLNAANTSGYNGVYPQNSHGIKTGRWVAQIGFKGRKYYLGVFDRVEDAAEARRKAEEKLYDGFLEWYYSEYLPAQKGADDKTQDIVQADAPAADNIINKKRTRGEPRTAEIAAVP